MAIKGLRINVTVFILIKKDEVASRELFIGCIIYSILQLSALMFFTISFAVFFS